MSDTTTNGAVRVRVPSTAPARPCRSRPAGSPTWPTARSSSRSATRPCCPRSSPASPARASTSSPSRSTSRSGCTPRARSPARSSGVRAVPASRRSSPAASPTARCARRSPTDFRNEVQVIATILGADLENPHDIASINGASAALTVSGIPFNGPIGAVRLAHHDGEWIAHPTYQEGDESTFEIVVAGRELDDGDVAIMMVEAGGTESYVGALRAGRAEGHRGDDRRGPRGVEAVDRGVDRPPGSSCGPRSRRRTARSSRSRTSRALDYDADVYAAVKAARRGATSPRR